MFADLVLVEDRVTFPGAIAGAVLNFRVRFCDRWLYVILTWDERILIVVEFLVGI